MALVCRGGRHTVGKRAGAVVDAVELYRRVLAVLPAIAARSSSRGSAGRSRRTSC